MKVAIAVDNNEASNHFGHCQGFKIYDIVNGKLESETFVENPGHKPRFLPNYLDSLGVKVIISLGMGKMAQEIFKQKDILVIITLENNLDKIIKQYIAGKLTSDNKVCNLHQFEGSCND